MGDSLVNLILQWIELIKSPMLIKIEKDTATINQLKSEVDTEPMNQIGFAVSTQKAEECENDI